MPTPEEIEAATRAVHKEMLNSATTTETIARSALAAAENFIIERCAQVAEACPSRDSSRIATVIRGLVKEKD
ncbi:MAG TPA: hypothetical protein VKD65_12080 [Candidatus Angelobacter sp.]|nr:hypothetical protein [Candidatus Angelobacter sp.]